MTYAYTSADRLLYIADPDPHGWVVHAHGATLMNPIQLLSLMALIGWLGCFATLAEQEDRARSVPRDDPDVLCARAEQLVKDIQRISPQLQRIVADEKAEIHDRCDAAIAIGLLRDLDGIDVLVKHLAELNSTLLPELWPVGDDTTFYCALALCKIGPASVPRVVPIYLYQDGWAIDSASWRVIIERTNYRFARGLVHATLARDPRNAKLKERADIFLDGWH